MAGEMGGPDEYQVDKQAIDLRLEHLEEGQTALKKSQTKHYDAMISGFKELGEKFDGSASKLHRRVDDCTEKIAENTLEIEKKTGANATKIEGVISSVKTRSKMFVGAIALAGVLVALLRLVLP